MEPPFDLILSSDTIYSNKLNDKLFKQIHFLMNSSNNSIKTLIAIEIRDKECLAHFLGLFNKSNLKYKRISNELIFKSVKLAYDWDLDNFNNWEGIEIYKIYKI